MIKKTLLAAALAVGLVGTASAGNLVNNDIIQNVSSALQGNSLLDVSTTRIGATTIDQVNAVNSATLVLDTGPATTSGSPLAGLYNNDISQTISGVAQGNIAISGLGANTGAFTLSQTNLGNIAESDLDAWDLVNNNDVIQRAQGVLQGNVAVVAQGVNVGDLSLDQVNAINSATFAADLVANGGHGEFVTGNTVNQKVTGVPQVNKAFVFQAGTSVGATTLSQANLGNISDVDIDYSGLAGAYVDNDTIQYGANLSQLNKAVVLHGVNTGVIDISQVNAVNSATVSLTGVTSALGNGISQTAGNIAQGNGIAVASLTNVGAINLSSANLINVGSLTIKP